MAGDPVNQFDLDGERCWTGVARKEKIVFKDKNGKWTSKTISVVDGGSTGL